MSAEFDQKIHTTLADANLQLAIYTSTGRLKEGRIDVRCYRRAARLPGAAHPGQRHQEARHREPRLLPGRVRAQRRGARRQGGLLQGRHRGRRFRAGAGQRARRAPHREIQVHDHRGSGPQRAAGAPRPGIGGDRPGRIHPATGPREAVPHRGAGAAQDALRRGRDLQPEPARAQGNRAREADRHRPRACCARNFWPPISASAAPISWWPIRAPWCWWKTKATRASPPPRPRSTSPSPASRR